MNPTHLSIMNPNLQKVIGGPSIPGTMQMKSLETLSLTCCHKLQILPEFHSNMTSLRTLLLNGSGIKDLPWSLGCLTSLQKIDMSDCFNLRALPNSLCGLRNLESIKLYSCLKLKSFFENPDDKAFHCFNTQQSSLKGKRAENKDASKILTDLLSIPSLRTLTMSHCNVSKLILPESNGCFGSLEELDLSHNNFVSIPESINRFSCIRYLHLSGCKKLEALPELPQSIKELNLDDCKALNRIPNLVDLLDKYENLDILSLVECEQLVQKQDQFDSPQNNALGRSVPQFLIGLSDRIKGNAESNILCNRQEVVQVNLPCNYLFDWLHKSTSHYATVTLSPSCFYNNKLRGFVICTISNSPAFEMVTDNGRVTIIPSPSSYRNVGLAHTFFFYIPIGKIRHGTDRNKKEDYCLLEVTNADWYTDTRDKIRWGIALVYDTEVNMDFSDLTVTSSRFDPYEIGTLKVCVAPRIIYSESNTV